MAKEYFGALEALQEICGIVRSFRKAPLTITCELDILEVLHKLERAKDSEADDRVERCILMALPPVRARRAQLQLAYSILFSALQKISDWDFEDNPELIPVKSPLSGKEMVTPRISDIDDAKEFAKEEIARARRVLGDRDGL